MKGYEMNESCSACEIKEKNKCKKIRCPKGQAFDATEEVC